LNAQSETSGSKQPSPPAGGDVTLAPEIHPMMKRDRLLQHVRAARKRLPSVPRALPKLP
jgi:hypothetical protein